MLPAKRREVLEQVGPDCPTGTVEVVLCRFEIGGVPKHDCARDQVQGARTMTLGLKAGVTDTADTVKEDGAFQRVLRFALVQLARGSTSLLGDLDPVERKQGSLHAPDLAQRQR